MATTSLAVLELNHVALHVRDMEASNHFYGELLGLPRLPRPDFNFDGAWYAFGNQELHLIANPNHDPTPRFYTHFALRVADAHAAHAALIEAGIAIHSGPGLRPDGAVQVYILDPDGYLIEITSFPDP